MWLVSRHEDVRAVLLDHNTFLADNTLDAVTPPSFATLRRLVDGGFRLPATLANNSGASHPELRRIATRFIGPASVSKAQPLIIEAACSAIDRVATQLDTTGSCDLAASIARYVPCRVILSLLGMKHVDLPTFVRWSNAALELFWGRPSASRQQVLASEVTDFHRWLGDQLDSLDGDNDGMLASLVRTQQSLSRDEIIGACFFTLIAGQETTTQLLASSFFHLLNDPARWASLREHPQATMGWVEEILRREPPISTWRRVTSRATELRGVQIPANASVLLMLTSAGSDEKVFDDAAELCPHRENARDHLAFGLGRHRCPGAELSRAEAEITLRTAAGRLPALRLVEPRPPMLELLSFRSPSRVLVTRA